MEKDSRRGNTSYPDHTQMAITNVVPDGNKVSKENFMVQERSEQFVPSAKVIDYQRLKEHTSSSMPLLDQNLRAQGFEKADIKFLRKAWQTSTKKVFELFETMGSVL